MTAHRQEADRGTPPISEASVFAALEAAFPTPAEPRVIGHPALDASSAGQHIGRYAVRGILGRGGMGSVYRAFDPVLEREVALKVMLPEMVGDAELKQRFEREARAVARLSHPCVVTVFDLGYHTDGSPYIVMELLRGRDLHDRMYDGRPFPVAEKVGIVAQVLDGLGHAHRAGIVHRDIKPANVFLTDDGTARIMDFGLAFFTASGATSRSILGTVAYMSAEQVRGGRLDGRSDLFSAGTVLCELLTGRRPFDADDPGRTLYRIANEEPDIVFASDEDRRRFLPILRRALTATRRSATRPRPSSRPVPGLPRRARSTRPARRRAPPRRADDEPPLRAAARGVRPRQDRPAPPLVRGQLQEPHDPQGGPGAARHERRCGKPSAASSCARPPRDDVQRAVAVVLGERRRLGDVLAGMRLLDAASIAEAVGIHVREILFSALDRADASFSFEELAESNLDDDLACPQSMGQVILEATRRVFDPELVRRLLGDTSRPRLRWARTRGCGPRR
ncbi:MAG: serine/threonine-protein kinase [Vicinamibacteria bacterium]